MHEGLYLATGTFVTFVEGPERQIVVAEFRNSRGLRNGTTPPPPP